MHALQLGKYYPLLHASEAREIAGNIVAASHLASSGNRKNIIRYAAPWKRAWGGKTKAPRQSLGTNKSRYHPNSEQKLPQTAKAVTPITGQPSGSNIQVRDRLRHNVAHAIYAGTSTREHRSRKTAGQSPRKCTSSQILQSYLHRPLRRARTNRPLSLPQQNSYSSLRANEIKNSENHKLF